MKKTYTLQLSAAQIYNLGNLLFTSQETDSKGKVSYGHLADGGKSMKSVEKKLAKLGRKAGVNI